MEALSLDLRERMSAACDEGDLTRQDVADAFVVSRSFVQKLLRRRCDGRPLAPKPRSGGAAPLLGEQDLERLRRLVREKPDRTLAELRAALHESGGPAVSVPTVCRAGAEEAGPAAQKKTPHASERDTRGRGGRGGSGRRRRRTSRRRS